VLWYADAVDLDSLHRAIHAATSCQFGSAGMLWILSGKIFAFTPYAPAVSITSFTEKMTSFSAPRSAIGVFTK
jgi:hypothetical protein